MNNFQYKFPNLWILILSCLLWSTIAATAQTKQEVIDAWKQQITSIDSLQLDYESSLVVKGKDKFSITWKQNFAQSGKKYFSYLTLADESTNTGFTEMAAAFNGTNYQWLTKENGKYTISTAKSPTKTQYPYRGTHPLTKQYEFLFIEGESQSIETLKAAKTWERLSDRIISIKESSHDRVQGYIVTIKSSRSDEAYRVFVDKNTYFPRYWSNNIQHPLDIERTEISNMNVQKAISVIDEHPVALFPVEIVFRELREGKTSAEVKIITDDTSLRINNPIMNKIFILSKPNATYINLDKELKMQ